MRAAKQFPKLRRTVFVREALLRPDASVVQKTIAKCNDPNVRCCQWIWYPPCQLLPLHHQESDVAQLFILRQWGHRNTISLPQSLSRVGIFTHTATKCRNRGHNSLQVSDTGSGRDFKVVLEHPRRCHCNPFEIVYTILKFPVVHAVSRRLKSEVETHSGFYTGVAEHHTCKLMKWDSRRLGYAFTGSTVIIDRIWIFICRHSSWWAFSTTSCSIHDSDLNGLCWFRT